MDYTEGQQTHAIVTADFRHVSLISEPFDMTSWLLILLLCIHVVALGVYTFEYFSPARLDKGDNGKGSHSSVTSLGGHLLLPLMLCRSYHCSLCSIFHYCFRVCAFLCQSLCLLTETQVGVCIVVSLKCTYTTGRDLCVSICILVLLRSFMICLCCYLLFHFVTYLEISTKIDSVPRDLILLYLHKLL